MANVKTPAGTYKYNGETKQGYIKDGKTYTDENYTTEVPVGSTVYTNDGPYVKTGGGSFKMDETPVSPAAPAASKGNGVRYTVNGVAKDGYMKDGVTYTDKTMAQRVPNGAIVQTAGGTYEMTANGGVPTAQTTINNFQKQSTAQTDAFTAAKEAQDRQIRSNVNAAISRFQSQRDQAYKDKEEADRAAYNTFQRATNPYGANAQQMASLGLGGSGFAETNLASIGNQYQQNMNNNLIARNKALSELNVLIEEARAAGDEQRANLLMTYAQGIANMGMDSAKTIASLSQNAANNAYARSRDVISDERYADELAYNRQRDAVADQRYAEETAYNREQNTLSTAFQLVDKGVSPENVAKILNLSPEITNALWGYYARQV